MSTIAGVALVGTVALAPSAAEAQDYTSGVITGRVVDSSGKAIAGATITATSNQTGIAQSAKSSASGVFSLNNMPIGDYEVTVTAPGFNGETESQVVVEASKQSNFEFALVSETATAGEVVVKGTRRKLAFSTATTGVVLDVEKLTKDVPVGRNLTSLVLLAPGTVKGDAAFGNLASVGGSSVAENAYYLNGMNITDFNNYLGSSSVPFEFFKSVEVKEGGQPAEFGRATGGVINSVTKSGTNQFKGAFHLNFTPDSLAGDAPNTVGAANQFDYSDAKDAVLELSGPIWKDHLYAYGLVQQTQSEDRNGDFSKTMRIDEQDNTFYGLKLDGYINPDHHLELTYFDTSRTVTSKYYDYDGGRAAVCSPDLRDDDQAVNDVFDNCIPDKEYYFIGTGALGALGNTNTQHYGAPSWVFKYTGKLTDWFTISAATGVNQDESRADGGDLPYLQDASSTGLFGSQGLFGNAQRVTLTDGSQNTERKFNRIDADFHFNFLGDHHLRTGWEKEENHLVHFATRTGPENSIGNAYATIYRRCGTNARCSSGTGEPLLSSDLYVELNYYKSGGEFDAENIAYYVQDEWKVNNKLTLNLGYRVDEFNNFTADGSQFIDLNGNGAARLGFSYDPAGDGRSRLFGFYGTYYLPVASNTAFRQAGSEYFFREYWSYAGKNADNTPILGYQLTGWTNSRPCPKPVTATSAAAGTLGCVVTGDGSVADPTAAIDVNLKATKENEFILGYEQKFGDLWTLGVTYLNRDLEITAEDSAVDAAVNAYCVQEGITGCSSIWTGYHQYVINNPGQGATIVLRDPLPGETDLRTVTFSAADLGYPKAKRAYDALEFTFKRAFDGKWTVNGSYTLSRSRGNSEGYVQSDFGQDDAGITQDFDQPGFVVGSSGLLPNDRTHKFKLWGSYAFNDNFTLGTQVQISSPRHLSCFGFDPTNRLPATPGQLYQNFENGYGAASHYCGLTPDSNGNSVSTIVPRGKGPTTDWIKQIDISARYRFDTPIGETVLRADIFNILASKGVQYRNEVGDLNNGKDTVAHNYNYGHVTQYQSPRYVRVGVDVNF